MHISMVFYRMRETNVHYQYTNKPHRKTQKQHVIVLNRTIFRTLSKTLIKLFNLTEQYAPKKTLYIEG